MKCQSCGAENPEGAERCSVCHDVVGSDEFVDDEPVYEGKVPIRNSKALAAFYYGLFSFLPVLGALLAIPAILFGLQGRRAFRERPEIGGAGHALIGILLGTIFLVAHIVVAIVLATAAE